MTKFEVIVAGQVLRVVDTREEAEQLLTEAKRGILGMVHCKNSFWINEK